MIRILTPEETSEMAQLQTHCNGRYIPRCVHQLHANCWCPPYKSSWVKQCACGQGAVQVRRMCINDEGRASHPHVRYGTRIPYMI
jgi:hypothetical protein